MVKFIVPLLTDRTHFNRELVTTLLMLAGTNQFIQQSFRGSRMKSGCASLFHVTFLLLLLDQQIETTLP